jgi:hypothetical protein
MEREHIYRLDDDYPANIHLDIPAGTLHILTHDQPTITVRITADDEAAEKLAFATRVTHHGSTVTVIVPRPDASQTVAAGKYLIGNIANNVMIVNGQVITNGVITPGVNVTVYVPSTGSARIKTMSTDIHQDGTLATVEAVTMSGDVVLDHVHSAYINTQSGDVRIRHVDECRVQTMSGDVAIQRLRTHAKVSTMSGDVRAHGNPDAVVSARTMSGDITITGTTNTETRTMSGRVHTS